LYITEVLKEYEGDTYFPKVDYSKWIKTYESSIYEENGNKFKFFNYKKI
ncbi:dihydrofolate reductase, partial [Clostridium perfringens]